MPLFLARQNTARYTSSMTRNVENSLETASSVSSEEMRKISILAGTKTLTETRENQDQDPNKFFPRSFSDLKNLPSVSENKRTRPQCFIQLFQETAIGTEANNSTPTKTSTATREEQDQDESNDWASGTQTQTRTREESDQDRGTISYHAVPRM